MRRRKHDRRLMAALPDPTGPVPIAWDNEGEPIEPTPGAYAGDVVLGGYVGSDRPGWGDVADGVGPDLHPHWADRDPVMDRLGGSSQPS